MYVCIFYSLGTVFIIIDTALMYLCVLAVAVWDPMNRFIADLFKIKAEMICENFDREKLLSFLPKDKNATSAQATILNFVW